MEIFNKKDFLNLADVHDKHCVSIYIPTHRGGGDEGELKDRTLFKNQLKEVKRKLKEYSLTENEISAYVKPLEDFLDQESFWRKLSDTLAVFLHDKELTYHLLPIQVEEMNYVADHFFLTPLSPILNRNSRFFIMVLSLGKMRFFDATQHTLTEVEMEGLIPREIEESILVNADDNEKQLQWRSNVGEPSQAAMYHGHGAGNDSEKKEQILSYFREIDKGIMEMLHDEKAPLIIAGVDYLFPIYKEANNYKYLYKENLSGNFDEVQPAELHSRIWELIKDDMEADITSKKERYHELLSADKAAYKLEEVIPGSIVGRTETLFIEKNKHVWGNFNAENHSIKIDEEKFMKSACILNRSAIGTIRNGGEVFILEKDEMPDKVTAAAIFRYEMK